MKWNKALLAMLCGFLVPSLAFPCSVWNGHSVSYTSTKLRIAGSVPSTISNGVQHGINQWNDENLSGFDFPWFSKNSGQVVVDVIYIDGLAEPSGYSPCGTFSGPTDGSSGVIYMFSQGRAHGQVADCFPSVHAAGDLVAHELGHYLGLGNRNVHDGSIMGGAAHIGATNRAITACEANRVDTVNSNNIEFAHECSNVGGSENPFSDPQDFDPCADDGNGNTPIIFDFGRRGFALTSLEDGVAFDIDADLEKEGVSWTAEGALDGFLVRDVDNNGLIEGGRELFGGRTIGLLTGEIWEHGYKPLAEFDVAELGGNQNGMIDRDDVVYNQLMVWVDVNHNGISESEELFGLAELGVERVSHRYWESQRVDEHGNEFRYMSRAWIRKGDRLRRLLTADVFFVVAD